MAESAVSFLLDQLSVWLQDERQLLGGLEREVEHIRCEMGHMRDFLRIADAKEESNPSLKEWVGQVREISYDVQDVLDKYMLRFTNFGYASMKYLKARRQIASEIQEIKYRIEDASKSQQRYREIYAVMDQGSNSTTLTNQWYDGRSDALFLKETDVVGITKPKEKLLEWIQLMGNGLDVISVVGMGGLGKTTLVKKVYDDELVKRHFNSHVWIVASDYTDVKHLLANLIKKLVWNTKESPPQELEDMSADEMREFIYQFLHHKNYIIVLDDVWDISRWEAIIFAFPIGGAHGCIIITTRFNSIANAACSTTNHMYNLKPLPWEESKRCEGLPLAIVVIGGLLATKNNRAEEWEQFNRSISDELEGGNLQKLSKIISLSYYDLPYYLKYCFMYLSIFPEGSLLEKEKVIRLWTTERFVQVKQDKTTEEVVEDYLNELLSRSLIQVADKAVDGRPRTFRIHDLLRQYITSKSREQNTVAIYGGGEMKWPSKIQRLAMQNSINIFNQETDNFKYIRSLLLLHIGVVESIPIKELISKSRLLKVLDFGGAPLETIPTEVFKLYHLKYLSLRNTMVTFIPKSIKYLENLETLDLKNSKLRCIDADEVDGIKMVREIGKLTQLRRLGIAKLRRSDGMELCSSIAKLTNLRSLSICSIEEGEMLDLDYSMSSASLPFLRTFELCGFLEKVPQWLPSLSGLTVLLLKWSKLREDPLNCLEDLPNLARLVIHGSYVEGLNFKAHGFQKLKY
ncbi:hypothetical protein DH2020_022872 [Rehmannia glutinosa]|uniref:Disease resistance protein RPM1-like n=1 Tax=Rehmannia glutinosa TaxID=99300 RepID=A0ABR0W668_REHGL